jgi:hypothetical protein
LEHQAATTFLSSTQPNPNIGTIHTSKPNPGMVHIVFLVTMPSQSLSSGKEGEGAQLLIVEVGAADVELVGIWMGLRMGKKASANV